MAERKLKIAILYIGLGQYSVLWNEFYESAKKYLFCNDIKHFFVFTDDSEILKLVTTDVSTINWDNLGVTGSTQFRYKMFVSIKAKLCKYDYIYFFNGNAVFVKQISREILPDPYKLIFAEHFKYRGKNNLWLPYIRDKKNTAYVPWGKGKNWIQACFMGGTSEEFLKMVKELDANTDTNVTRGVDCYPFDEAQANCYIVGKQYKLLPVSYVYPEVLKLPGDINILMRDKDRYFKIPARTRKMAGIIGYVFWKINNQIKKIKLVLNIAYYEMKLLVLGHY